MNSIKKAISVLVWLFPALLRIYANTNALSLAPPTKEISENIIKIENDPIINAIILQSIIY